MTLFLVTGVLGLSLAASPDLKLGPAERLYFGKQLEVVLAKVEAGLGAQGIRCVMGAPIAGGAAPRRDDPASWPSEAGKGSPFGAAPRSWQVMLDCTQSGLAPFRAALDLEPSALIVPRKALLNSGPGWGLRDVGGNTDALLLGDFSVIEPGAGLPRPKTPEKPPTLAVARSAMFAVENGPGKPKALDVLAALDAKPLNAALQAAAALPAPRSDLPAYVPPKDAWSPPAAPQPPAEVPYTASTEPEPPAVKLTLGKADQEGLGRLERLLDADERAYFATVRARAIAAALKATADMHCVYSPGGETRTDTSAEPGPDGYESSTRFADALSCKLESGRQVSVGVQAMRRWAPGPHASVSHPRQLAPDATLERMEATASIGSVELVVGEQSTAKERAEVMVRPSLQRLGAVRLSAIGDKKELDEVEALLAKVALAPLQALLRAPPPLPPSRPLAKEGPRATAPRGPVELAVYEAVLGPTLARSVLSDTLSTGRLGNLGTGTPKLAALVAPDLLPSAMADFNEVAKLGGPLPAALSPATPRLSAAEQASYFSDKNRPEKHDGWKEFRAKFGNVRIVNVTRVGLSADQTQAIVGVSWQGDWLAGSGDVFFLRKTETGWEVIYRLRRWVS